MNIANVKKEDYIFWNILGDKDRFLIPVLLARGEPIGSIMKKYGLTFRYIYKNFYKNLPKNIIAIDLETKNESYYENEAYYGRKNIIYKWEDLNQNELKAYHLYNFKQKTFMKKYKINTVNKNKIWSWLQNNNIAQRGRFDGNKENQLIGLIGETEFYNLLFNEYPIFKNGFDNGIDILYENLTIDVKTVARNVECKEHYVNNFLECQLNYNCDIIVFVSVNKKENYFQVCGYLPKKEIKTKGEYFKKGDIRKRDNGTSLTIKENMYEISNKNIYKFNKLKL